MSEGSFADYMKQLYGIGKGGWTPTISEVFQSSLQEVDNQIDECSRLIKKRLHKIQTLGFDETKTQIILELDRLRSELSEEIYTRIELLVIASFAAGEDTRGLSSAIIGCFKGEKIRDKRRGWNSGKENQPNPVLVKAIKDEWKKDPDISASKLIETLIRKAGGESEDEAEDGDGELQVGGYDILFKKKGQKYNGKVLKNDSFVCYRVDLSKDEDEHGSIRRTVTPNSLKKYCTKIKNGEL